MKNSLTKANCKTGCDGGGHCWRANALQLASCKLRKFSLREHGVCQPEGRLRRSLQARRSAQMANTSSQRCAQVASKSPTALSSSCCRCVPHMSSCCCCWFCRQSHSMTTTTASFNELIVRCMMSMTRLQDNDYMTVAQSIPRLSQLEAQINAHLCSERA